MSVDLQMTSGSLNSPASVAPAAYQERAVRFGANGALTGILTVPARVRPGAPAVLFLTAGLLHRVGPNRLYVRLARELAADGFTCVRFDLAGMGDSQPRTDGTPADEAAVIDTQQVMHAIEGATGARTFVLAGLCSGAVLSFHTACRDQRVAGMLLLNPQGFDHDATWNAHVLNLTQARRYLTTAATSSSNWKRALTGRIDYRRALRVLLRRAGGAVSVRAARQPVADRLLAGFDALKGRGVQTLAICCDGDSSVDYMTQILGTDVADGFTDNALEVRVYAGTDHSFTLLAAQSRLSTDVRHWLQAHSWSAS